MAARTVNKKDGGKKTRLIGRVKLIGKSGIGNFEIALQSKCILYIEGTKDRNAIRSMANFPIPKSKIQTIA